MLGNATGMVTSLEWPFPGGRSGCFSQCSIFRSVENLLLLIVAVRNALEVRIQFKTCAIGHTAASPSRGLTPTVSKDWI